MSRLGRKGITFKLSLITGGLLIVCTAIIFLVYYFLLPGFYRQYKLQSLDKALEQLIWDSAQVTLHDAKDRLDEFTQEYNVWMGIQGRDGRFIYVPSVFNEREEAIEAPSGSANMPLLLKKIQIPASSKDMHTISKPIAFRDGGYTLVASATLQPINEASQAMLLFAPYMIVLVLFISVAGAIVYSRFVAKPLLALNRTAKRMANLDWDSAVDIRSGDELGELSRSLNKLSRSLQVSMAELKQTNEQLSVEIVKEKKLERKRKEFIATISHELKTPITAVMGQIEGMIHRVGAYRDRDKYLNRSYAVMQDMEKLVQELLDLSKLDVSGFSPNRESVHLSEIVKESIGQLEFASNAKDVVVIPTITDGVYILADRKLIGKVVANVIRNAVQYADVGGQVRIRLEQSGASVVLQVHNTGEPIPEDQLSRIFEPFHRVEKSRSRHTGGSGLGLYIVQRIVEAHGAACSIENTEEGVRFTVEFAREALA